MITGNEVLPDHGGETAQKSSIVIVYSGIQLVFKLEGNSIFELT